MNPFRMGWPVGGLGLALVGVGVAAACGSSDDGELASKGAGGGANIDPDSIHFGVSPDGGGGGDPFSPVGTSSCGGDLYAPEGREIDIAIMMDRSASMIGFTAFGMQSGDDLWVPVSQALTQFVADPGSAGLGVGIGFFGIPDGSGCSTCDVNVYAAPAANIAPLPGNEPLVTQAIGANSPAAPAGCTLQGSTATRPALEGAMTWAKNHQAANPGRKTIIILATDGEPNACNSNIQNVSQIAADGHATAPSIETYVIGIGNIGGLNQIAEAGGTREAIIVSTDPAETHARFFDAMNVIRGLALPCDYALPRAEGVLDRGQVNLEFTPAGGVTRTVGHVANEGACDATRGGWYYEGERIVACPTSCGEFKQAAGATVNVVVGCTTEVLVQ